MGLKDFDAKSICSIIKECCRSGVTKFKLGDLELEFGDVNQRTQIPLVSHTRPGKFREADPTKIQNIDEHGQYQDEILSREEEAELMLLEDPERFEEMLAQGEFEDVNESEQTEKAL